MSIELINATKSFGEQLILSDVTLKLPEKVTIGVVGKNGAGKTTLLNCLAGKMSLDSGEIRLSETASYLSQFLNKDSQKSGGQQTKLKIDQAFRAEASLILADEPTNHLDQNGVHYFIRSCQQFEGTVLLVSHNRYLLEELADYILEVDKGSVTLYKGNYLAYSKQKEKELIEHDRSYEEYMKTKAQLSKAAETLANKSRQTRKAPKRMGNSEARLHKRGKQQQAQKRLNQQKKVLETRISKLDKIEKIRNEKNGCYLFLKQAESTNLTQLLEVKLCFR